MGIITVPEKGTQKAGEARFSTDFHISVPFEKRKTKQRSVSVSNKASFWKRGEPSKGTHHGNEPTDVDRYGERGGGGNVVPPLKK